MIPSTTTAIVVLAVIVAAALAGYWAGWEVRAGLARKQLDARDVELEALRAEYDATCEAFADWVEDHAGTYPPTIWSDAVLPGGQVCAVPVDGGGICGMPVESEPCPFHTCHVCAAAAPHMPSGICGYPAPCPDHGQAAA